MDAYCEAPFASPPAELTEIRTVSPGDMGTGVKARVGISVYVAVGGLGVIVAVEVAVFVGVNVKVFVGVKVPVNVAVGGTAVLV